MATTEAATCQSHAALLQLAHTCRADLDNLDHDPRLRAAPQHDQDGARYILETVAEHCQHASEVFTLDPTLADEQRVREVDRLTDLGRQLRSMLRRVLSAPAGDHLVGRDGTAIQQTWHEAHLLAERVPSLTAEVLARAQLDHDTVAGQHAISLRRLVDNISVYPQALQHLRDALEPALKLASPHPHAEALVELLDQLSERVAAVQTSTDRDPSRCSVSTRQEDRA